MSNKATPPDLFAASFGHSLIVFIGLNSSHIAENSDGPRSGRKHPSNMIVLLTTASVSVGSLGVRCGRLRWWLSFSLGGCHMKMLWDARERDREELSAVRVIDAVRREPTALTFWGIIYA